MVHWLQTSDGAKYKGVLSKINADGLMLRIASLVFDGLDEVKFAKPEECKIIADSGWSKLEAVDVKVGAADVGPIGTMDDAGGFGTDSAISRGKGGYDLFLFFVCFVSRILFYILKIISIIKFN